MIAMESQRFWQEQNFEYEIPMEFLLCQKYLKIFLTFKLLCNLELYYESLILAQDERWRRA